jgi:hypothetical protein
MFAAALAEVTHQEIGDPGPGTATAAIRWRSCCGCARPWPGWTPPSGRPGAS